MNYFEKKQYEKLLLEVAGIADVCPFEAQLFLDHKHAELSQDVLTKFWAARESLENHSLVKISQATKPNLLLAKPTPNLSTVIFNITGPDKTSPPSSAHKKPSNKKRKKSSESLAVDKAIEKLLSKELPNKELLRRLQIKFPKMDLTLDAVKMRKYRLRKRK